MTVLPTLSVLMDAASSAPHEGLAWNKCARWARAMEMTSILQSTPYADDWARIADYAHAIMLYRIRSQVRRSDHLVPQQEAA